MPPPALALLLWALRSAHRLWRADREGADSRVVADDHDPDRLGFPVECAGRSDSDKRRLRVVAELGGLRAGVDRAVVKAPEVAQVSQVGQEIPDVTLQASDRAVAELAVADSFDRVHRAVGATLVLGHRRGAGRGMVGHQFVLSGVVVGEPGDAPGQLLSGWPITTSPLSTTHPPSVAGATT